MGCGFTTAKYQYENTSHALRTRQDKRIEETPEFHRKFVLDCKIVHYSFGQINLAHKVKIKEEKYSSEVENDFASEKPGRYSSGGSAGRYSSGGSASDKPERLSGGGSSKPLKRSSSMESMNPLKRSSSMRMDVVELTAVKIVDYRMAGKKMLQLLQNELNHWKSLKHEDHVMELKETFQSKDLCYLVMEHSCGSLLFYLQRIPKLNERTIGNCFSQMLMGMGFLHSSNVIHRGIKPDSFLVGFEGDDEGGKKTIKICDFTLATNLSPGKTKAQGECGAPAFMSPEMVSSSGYDMKTDVWSFGIIVYGLLFGRFPFDYHGKDSEDIKACIAKIRNINFKTTIRLSASCVAFAMPLLAKDPSERPSAQESLQKAYMVEVIEESHLVGERIPDLRPMMQKIMHFRAFEYHELDEKSAIDDRLMRHQMAAHGLPLPNVDDTSVVLGGVSGKALESAKKLEKRNSGGSSMALGSSAFDRWGRTSVNEDEEDEGEAICDV